MFPVPLVDQGLGLGGSDVTHVGVLHDTHIVGPQHLAATVEQGIFYRSLTVDVDQRIGGQQLLHGAVLEVVSAPQAGLHGSDGIAGVNFTLGLLAVEVHQIGGSNAQIIHRDLSGLRHVGHDLIPAGHYGSVGLQHGFAGSQFLLDAGDHRRIGGTGHQIMNFYRGLHTGADQMEGDGLDHQIIPHGHGVGRGIVAGRLIAGGHIAGVQGHSGGSLGQLDVLGRAHHLLADSVHIAHLQRGGGLLFVAEGDGVGIGFAVLTDYLPGADALIGVAFDLGPVFGQIGFAVGSVFQRDHQTLLDLVALFVHKAERHIGRRGGLGLFIGKGHSLGLHGAVLVQGDGHGSHIQRGVVGGHQTGVRADGIFAQHGQLAFFVAELHAIGHVDHAHLAVHRLALVGEDHLCGACHAVFHRQLVSADADAVIAVNGGLIHAQVGINAVGHRGLHSVPQGIALTVHKTEGHGPLGGNDGRGVGEGYVRLRGRAVRKGDGHGVRVHGGIAFRHQLGLRADRVVAFRDGDGIRSEFRAVRHVVHVHRARSFGPLISEGHVGLRGRAVFKRNGHGVRIHNGVVRRHQLRLRADRVVAFRDFHGVSGKLHVARHVVHVHRSNRFRPLIGEGHVRLRGRAVLKENVHGVRIHNAITCRDQFRLRADRVIALRDFHGVAGELHIARHVVHVHRGGGFTLFIGESHFRQAGLTVGERNRHRLH